MKKYILNKLEINLKKIMKKLKIGKIIKLIQ